MNKRIKSMVYATGALGVIMGIGYGVAYIFGIPSWGMALALFLVWNIFAVCFERIIR